MSEITPPVSVSLTVKDGNAALDFYEKAFGAKILCRMASPSGGLGHGEFEIGATRIYISDPCSDWHAKALPEEAMAPCVLSIPVENCDTAFKKAIAAGGKSLMEPENRFWGIRTGMILDPFGYRWSLGQFLEEVSYEEMERRAKEIFGG